MALRGFLQYHTKSSASQSEIFQILCSDCLSPSKSICTLQSWSQFRICQQKVVAINTSLRRECFTSRKGEWVYQLCTFSRIHVGLYDQSRTVLCTGITYLRNTCSTVYSKNGPSVCFRRAVLYPLGKIRTCKTQY